MFLVCAWIQWAQKFPEAKNWRPCLILRPQNEQVLNAFGGISSWPTKIRKSCCSATNKEEATLLEIIKLATETVISF